MRHWRLRAQIAALTVVSVIVVTGLVCLFVSWRVRDAMNVELHAHGTAMSAELARHSVGPLRTDDVWGAYTLLRDVKGQSESPIGIAYALLLDTTGRVFAASDPRRFPTGNPLIGSPAGRSPAGHHIIDFVTPVRVEGEWLGTVRIGLSDQYAQATAAGLVRQIAGAGAIAALAAALAAIALAGRMTRPLVGLAAATDRIAEGDDTAPIDPGPGAAREIRGLAARFNTMVASLRAERTAREQAQEALQRSFERLDLAVRGTSEGIWDWDLERGVVWWSAAVSRMLGRAEHEEPTTDGLLERVHPSDLPALYRALNEHLDRGQPFEVEFRARAQDGEFHWYFARARAARDASERPFRMSGLITDVTERRQLQEQLLQAQKMEGIGRLAGGIARGFNNLLTVILSNDELLRHDVGDPALRDDLGQIQAAGERAASLTSQLLAFARKQVTDPRPMNLNDLALQSDKMLRRLIGEDIELVTTLAPVIGAIRADSAQLEQVLLNVVINARDAMPGGGKVLIETAEAELDEEYASRHPGVSPGPYAVLSVTDTGTGMTPEVLARAFEPFFTTKPVGQGTGLGLATSYGIVRQHGGHIWTYSELGVGTTLKFYFPVVGLVAAAITPAPDAPLPGGHETILLVEDEPGVLAAALRILTMVGYRVMTATNGEEALQIADTTSERFDLVFTDVVMPRLGGRELVERLRHRRPDVTVLFASGYTDEGIVEVGGLERGAAFLSKPYTPQQLCAKVRAVLDAHVEAESLPGSDADRLA